VWSKLQLAASALAEVLTSAKAGRFKLKLAPQEQEGFNVLVAFGLSSK